MRPARGSVRTRAVSIPPLLQAAAAGAAALALALALGYLIPSHPNYALLGAVAVLVLGVSLGEPAAGPLIVLPLLLISHRVAIFEVDFTVSDVALLVATLSAVIVSLRGVDPHTRTILWLIALYQFVTVFALLNNIYRANTLEWFHSGVLTAGGLLVGWTVGARGFARHGIRLIVVGSAGIALGALLLAVRNYAAGDFAPIYPAWPSLMHKNLAGTVFALTAVVCYIRPAWTGLGRWPAAIAFYVLSAALLATQSRQAMIGLAIAIALVATKRSPAARRPAFALVVAAAMVAVAWVMVRDQIRSGDRFNSINARGDAYQAGFDVWLDHPWLGAGLRWWYTDRYPGSSQPPNAELEVLSTVGVVGLAAFLVALAGTWIVLGRLGPEYAVLAQMVFLVRIAQSQFDIYWVSIQSSLPYVLIGICLGARSAALGKLPWSQTMLRMSANGSRPVRESAP